MTLTRNLKIERSGINPLRVDLLALFFLLFACSFAKAESEEEYLLDGDYHGKFSIELKFRDVLHYPTMTTGFDVAQYLSCKGMVAQVEIGITVTKSQVTGRTLNLINASEVRTQCFELFNGDLTDQLDSDGNFRGYEDISFSSVKTFKPKLTGSIQGGSIFEVNDWELQSNKFKWVKGLAPNIERARKVEAKRLIAEKLEIDKSRDTVGKEHLLDGHYHGEFFIEVNLKDPLHYNVFDNTAHDVSKHLACDGMVAQVQVGITVTASHVTGRTLNLIDASDVGKKCFELLNGDLTDYLDSGGTFRSRDMNSFSKLSSFQPRLTGSIGEGSIFEVKRWNLRSKKFEWMEGAAPDL